MPQRQAGSPRHPDPPELTLAALARAERQRPGGLAGVPLAMLLDHLQVPHRSARARDLAGQLRALADHGQVQRAHRHSVEVFSLTAAGRLSCERALHGGAIALPESPQHLRWRNARRVGAAEEPRMRVRLGELLAGGLGLLAAESPPHSDAWLELAEDLRLTARRLGCAAHCLREWPEPAEDRADPDDLREPGDQRLSPERREHRRVLRSGRRNLLLWSEYRPLARVSREVPR